MKNKKKNENKTIGILIGAIILVICVVAVALLIINNKNNSSVVANDDVKKIISNGETAVIYVENSNSKKCSKCSEIKNYLDEQKIKYVLYDVNKNSEEQYEIMLQTLNLNPKDFGYPAIIYVKEGHTYSDIINISDTKTIDTFVKNYNLEKVAK